MNIIMKKYINIDRKKLKPLLVNLAEHRTASLLIHSKNKHLFFALSISVFLYHDEQRGLLVG